MRLPMAAGSACHRTLCLPLRWSLHVAIPIRAALKEADQDWTGRNGSTIV